MVEWEVSGAGSLARRLAGLAALSLAAGVLIFVPDLVLSHLDYAADMTSRPKTLLNVFGVALLLTSVASRRFRMWAIAFLVVNQLIWVGCAVYFGTALRPEQLLLARYEVSDTLDGALAEWRTLLPFLAMVLATGLGLVVLQWPDYKRYVWRSAVTGWVLIGAAVAGAAFWSLHKRIEVAFPGTHTPSFYGPYQVAVSTLRMLSTSVAASAGMELRNQEIVAKPLDNEPVTVVVIMGESINAYRLSLFGFGADTTPELAHWRQSPPANFTFIPKIGISGGTATFGSVPSLIRMAYLPVEAQERGLNLFDLADRQGFKSWFLSAQTRNFLDAGGGAKNAVRIETDKENAERLNKVHDDMLVDFAREVPVGPERRFVFFHQRVNHAGYTIHCSHAPDGMYVFTDTTGTAQGKRQAAYDNGLRCWDRNVKALVDRFLDAPGAVHIFITADHSELMGEAGLWGHGMADVHAALVPMALLTNRPGSPVAQMFKSWSPPTTYRLAQTIARALGLEVATPGVASSRFYLNSTMPFALAGFMEVNRVTDRTFRVSTFARNGKLMNTKELALPELITANVAGAPSVAKYATGGAGHAAPPDSKVSRP